MHSQANFHIYADQRKFLLYFVTLLVISNHASSSLSINSPRRDQPGLQEFPSTTTDEDNSNSENKDGDLLESYTNWLLILPYLPVAALIIALCMCGQCGYKTIKGRQENISVQIDQPPTLDAENGQVIQSGGYAVWTVPAPPYSTVVKSSTFEIYEEDPPAYDTLFEVKEEKF